MNKENFGPLVGTQILQQKTYPNGMTLGFIYHEAYNAGGLIGSEFNGIAVAEMNQKVLIVDSIGRGSIMSGRYPEKYSGYSVDQIAKQLAEMSWNELCEEINSNERARFKMKRDDEPAEKSTPKGEVPAIFYAEDPHAEKEKFHKEGKRFLIQLAEAMGLDKTTLQIGSNRGGSAVLGEVSIYAPDSMIQVGESFHGGGSKILYRTREHENDYSGGRNMYIHFKPGQEGSTNVERIASQIKKTLAAERAPKGISL